MLSSSAGGNFLFLAVAYKPAAALREAALSICRKHLGN